MPPGGHDGGGRSSQACDSPLRGVASHKWVAMPYLNLKKGAHALRGVFNAGLMWWSGWRPEGVEGVEAHALTSVPTLIHVSMALISLSRPPLFPPSVLLVSDTT